MFHVTLGNKINALVENKIVSIQPITVKNSPASPISWTCGYSSAPEAMQTVGKNKPNIEKEFLPEMC